MAYNEEHHDWKPFKSWLFIFGLMASLMISMEIMMMIPEAPRHWDYGVIPFVPSESVYSTKVKIEEPADLMIEPLPDGKKMDDTANNASME